VRSSKYSNNLIETGPQETEAPAGMMLGLKGFQTAGMVISGVELAEKIRKGQFKTDKPGGATATLPELWRAALAA
jgi:hypothetical protein